MTFAFPPNYRDEDHMRKLVLGRRTWMPGHEHVEGRRRHIGHSRKIIVRPRPFGDRLCPVCGQRCFRAGARDDRQCHVAAGMLGAEGRQQNRRRDLDAAERRQHDRREQDDSGREADGIRNGRVARAGRQAGLRRSSFRAAAGYVSLNPRHRSGAALRKSRARLSPADRLQTRHAQIARMDQRDGERQTEANRVSVRSRAVRAGIVARSRRLVQAIFWSSGRPCPNRLPRLEADDRSAGIHCPAWRFVAAPDTLEIDPVLFEVQILFVPAYCANQPSYRTHNNIPAL